jgi:hypothetical protein
VLRTERSIGCSAGCDPARALDARREGRIVGGTLKPRALPRGAPPLCWLDPPTPDMPQPPSRPRRHARRAALAVLTALVAPAAAAQWSPDPAVNLTIADRPAGQVQPKAVPTPDGGFYVSWFGGGADGYDVYLQRLDREGVPQWADDGVRVADRDFSSTQDYGLALGSDGDALLAFRFTDPGGVVRIAVSRVAPDGTPRWGTPGVLVSPDAADANSPRVTGTADGAAVAAWTSSDGDLVLQRLDAAGAPEWGPSGVALTTPTGFFFAADLHAAADGGSVIVSGSAQLSFGDRRLWAQKLDAAGAPLWGPSPVEVSDGTSGALQLGYFPPFVPDVYGGAVFAWYEVSGVASARVRVQHVLADGALAFPQNGVEAATDASRVRFAPSAAYDAATGDVYVVWSEESASPPRQYGVSAQRIDAAGTRLWGASGVALVPLGGVPTSQVEALLAPGGAVFAWAVGSVPDPVAFYASRRDAAGAAVWPSAAVAFKTAPTNASRLQGALSTDGYAAYVWEDAPGPGAIKGQSVLMDGTLGSPPVAAESGGEGVTLRLRVAGPHPAPGAATLRYTLPEAADVHLEVLDALGRRVALLVDGPQGAAEHTLRWEAGGLPAGVYVARLRAGTRSATATVSLAR